MTEKYPTKHKALLGDVVLTHAERKSKTTGQERSEQTVINRLSKNSKKTAKTARQIKDQETLKANSHTLRHTKGPYNSHSASQVLNKTQSRLLGPERQFSKLIHNQKVEIISDVTAETLGRPSGLFFGGLLSLIGSLGAIIVCQFFGYEYSYTIGLVSFIVGFFCGIILEFIYKMIKR